jgi:hypothetical protein
MLEKTLAAVAGLIVLATVILVAVTSAALALFYVLEGPVGSAGAAAIVAGVFALLAAIAIALVATKGGGRQQHEEQHHHGGGLDFGFVERIIDMAKQKPILSIGAAVAALLIAIRNPALVATIVAAFIDKPKSK